MQDNHRASLRAIAQHILAHWGRWGLPGRIDDFLRDADGLAVLALLCGAAAKQFDDQFAAKYTSYLVRTAALAHTQAWAQDGIISIPTAYGQLHFQVFAHEDKGLPSAPGRQRRQRSEVDLHEYALECAWCYLGGMQIPRHAQDLIEMGRTLGDPAVIGTNRPPSH